MKTVLVMFTVFLYSLTPAFSGEGHGRDKGNKTEGSHSETDSPKHDGKEGNQEDKNLGRCEHGDGSGCDSTTHAESENHSEPDEHGESEENSQVGPTKGILEASETDGIKLSGEAEKNFGIDRIKVSSSEVIELPRSAIVRAVAEVNVFRYRNGFYKRIDFLLLNRSEDKIRISSKELKTGDEIVTRGLGFLRVAEIAAFGGAPEGH